MRVTAVLITLLAFGGTLSAQVPGEVGGVDFNAKTEMTWDGVTGADIYNVYRGELAADETARCHAFDLLGPPFDVDANPGPGEGWFFLVTGESSVDGEGTPGLGSVGSARALLGGCTQVMRNHVLNRAGFGWNEWTRDRIDTLGLDGYIAEQLVPISVNEFTNTDLFNRLNPITPPADIVELIQHQVINAVYARRQLQHQAATFWANHFNTDWQKIAEFYQAVFPQCDDLGLPVQCDPNYPARAYQQTTDHQFKELSDFKSYAFGGNFRQLLEASALSEAMIIYLDSYLSSAVDPNENYPRELMELYAMGVDGGYTQQDVAELSRVITGWTLCKKPPAFLDDPLGPCLAEYWDESVPGEIVTTFFEPNHDCGEKTLFAGTPEETVIAETCGDPAAGAAELYTALDAIVAHPSTPEFISRKILQRFVTETPSQALVDELVAVWNDGTNPHGVGDMQAVLAAALTSEAFLDPERVRDKIKTPMEQFASGIRAVRGRTDGLTTVLNSLVLAQHLPHFNPIPTGWPEDGDSWIDTNNFLERQNFGILLLDSGLPQFGTDVINLLEDNGVSTAPGNSAAIVDFLADTMFGGALNPTERQIAIDYLDTDEAGAPAPYDDARIRDTAAFLLGYPHFQEQ